MNVNILHGNMYGARKLGPNLIVGLAKRGDPTPKVCMGTLLAKYLK